jgi:eukaryotic-like serine/threonine-protein kinase
LSSLEPGTLVGRFRVVRLLAQGGMAEVYRAEQALAGDILRPAALKVIRPEFSQSEDFRQMFLDEARTACTLSHPHIAHIYEVGEVEGLLYMAMELVPGESLAAVTQALRARGERLSDEALLAVGIATCAALEAVHARPRLVHRDVSPQNLLLTAGGSLKLIDFGIAQAATNRNLTRVGTTKGKVGYFSPEQARGQSLDGRSDLFSLGVTLYMLAAGVTPLEELSGVVERHTALVRGQWEPLSRVCPELPRGFAAVVDRALRVRPEERFPNARAMREALEAVALEAGLPVGPGALAGYVREEDEEVSVSQVSPRRVRGCVSSRPVVRALPGRKVLAPVLGVGVGLALSAVGAAFLLPGQAPRPPPPEPLVAGLPERPVETGEPALEPPPVEAGEPALELPLVASPVEEVRAAPEVPSEPASPPARPERPRREPRRREGAVTAAAPEVVEEVSRGVGELRVGTAIGGRVEVKLPGRGREELPVNLRRFDAGRYTLEFFTAEGTASCEVLVRPDKRTRVVFEGTGCKVDHLN